MNPCRRWDLLAALPAFLAAACGAPEPPESTGGVDVVPGVCGRGAVVVSSDYLSTNVSLIDIDARVLSDSLLSSATSSAGLSAALSGDVVLPSSAADGDELVLIDRYPGSILTWVRLRDAKVTRQLSVKTGFAANPQDYLELADGRAYVTRFEPNRKPGSEPYDGGDDIVILDAGRSEIVGRIDLSSSLSGAPAGVFVRPSRMVRVGNHVIVLSQSYDKGFAGAASRLIRVDTEHDSVVDTRVLVGTESCVAMALSPNQETLAVSCAGRFVDGVPTPDSSFVVLLRTSSMEELGRVSATDLGGAPFSFGIGFLADNQLVISQFGAVGSQLEATRPDSVSVVRLPSLQASEVLRSDGEAFVLGDVRCFPECARCFVADAEHGSVRQLRLEADGSVQLVGNTAVGATIGLAPRNLGAF
ncbi:MAG: hypothetical protein R3B13_29930 [Polyangiaceae bacterium]